jgi:hypothetical protein
MKIIRSFEFDHCTIRQVSYQGGLHMPPHVDEESKIGIVLDGSLIEKSKYGNVEAKRNSVVIKPNHAVHENVFGHRGVRLLTINFKKDYPLQEILHKWNWFEDPRVSFSAYKLWYTIKCTRNDKELHKCLNAFIQSLEMVNKTQQNLAPGWVQSVAELLKRYSLDSETIDNISQQIKISRGTCPAALKTPLYICSKIQTLCPNEQPAVLSYFYQQISC